MFYFFKVAKKEFDDYIGSNIALFILVVFFIIFICSRYNSYVHAPIVQPGLHNNSWGMNTIFIYGSLVAIVLGLSSMYEEFGTKAINTLMSKPIYRDSFLNGKLLCAVCIAFLVFVFTSLVDIVLNIAFYGAAFTSCFSEFLSLLPVLLVLYLLCFMAFYLLTVLMFIVFKSSTLSLFLAFLSWVFIYIILPNITFASYISLIFGNQQYLGNYIGSLSPSSIIFNRGLMTSSNLADAFNAGLSEIIKMSLYVIVLLVLSYTAFLRRDIQ